MKRSVLFFIFPALIILYSCNKKTQKQDDLKFDFKPRTTNIPNAFQYDFEGYTEHWDKYSWTWETYTGIWDKSESNDIVSDLSQMEMAQGNQLLLEELWLQPGFVNHLHNSKYTRLNVTDKKTVMQELAKGDVMIIGTDRDSLVKELVQKLPEDLQYRRNRAFELTYGKNTLYVIASQTKDEADKLYKYITNALDIISAYKPYKGWAGVRSHYLLITQHVHSPYELIDRAMKMGCTWMMLDGYNDYMLTDPANKELSAIKLPFVLLPGQYGTGGIMYGTKTFPDVQDNTEEKCINWMQKNNGYFFGYLGNMKTKFAKQYNGYIIGSTADRVKLDSLKSPFITDAGGIDTQIPPSMVLFLSKKETLDQPSIMKAIMERRSVAVFPKADMYGDKKFKDALRILLLDRDYLESELISRVTAKCYIKNNELITELFNRGEKEVIVKYKYLLPASVSLKNTFAEATLKLGSCESRDLHNAIVLKPEACGKELPVGIEITYPGENKPIYAVCRLDVPYAVEQNPLMFDIPGTIDYPVTIWNYTNNSKVNVKLDIKSNQQIIKSFSQTVDIKNWQNKTINFSIPLKEGDYTATATAMGITRTGTIAIRGLKSSDSKVYTEDMNKDGIPEIVMENQQIKATILLFGGRIIEYIVKSRNQNMLFKLWPNKPPWDGKPEGRRAFYPYGGLEEFIGYPTIEGHIVFNYKILKDKGDYVRVKVWANIHGNRLEKTISLYGNSELIEVRYAFSNMDENIRIIGINPLIQIGKSTGPEDTYYFPDINGKIEKRHPVKERYYGNTFHLREGWAAGSDSLEKISLLVGYPVNDAEIFHLWNNHPNNTPTPYFYTELQPWLLIKHGTTTYFSYYLMGRESKYQPILDDFRKKGLVTTKQ